MKINKFKYYLINILMYCMPDIFFKNKLQKILNNKSKYDLDYINERVNYYNKLETKFGLNDDYMTLEELKKKKKNTYFFDLYKYTRYFSNKLKIKFIFGDVNYTHTNPTIVKSRPIEGSNNSILMKLNKVRHFFFVEDKLRFEDKKDMIVWRGGAYKTHRKVIVEQFYNHPLCDIGQTNNPVENVPWQKNKMSIEEQLKYK